MVVYVVASYSVSFTIIFRDVDAHPIDDHINTCNANLSDYDPTDVPRVMSNFVEKITLPVIHNICFQDNIFFYGAIHNTTKVIDLKDLVDWFPTYWFQMG